MRSHPYLKRLYNAYNKKYFSGRLPDICVRFGNAQDMRRAGVPKGTCAVTMFEGTKPYAIVVRSYASKSWGYVRADLIHEMAHVAFPRAGHGKVFQSEMKRLAAAGIFEGIW